MAYGNFGANSYDMNEAVKQQAYAQQQAQMAAQRQAEQQAYERQRQAFQEQMIAQEQARRNAESQASIANAKFELQQRHRRDPHATLKQQRLIQTQNEPAMENARQYGRSIDEWGRTAREISANQASLAQNLSANQINIARAQNEPAMENARQYGRSIDKWGEVASGYNNVLSQFAGNASAGLGGSAARPVGGQGGLSWSSSYQRGGMTPFRRSLLG